MKNTGYKTITTANTGKHARQKFATLYETYAKRIFQYFWYRSGQNAEEAEDLTQETFLRAFKRLPAYEDRGVPYLFYLLTIARNLLINFYRKPKPITLDETMDIPDPSEKDVTHKMEIENLWRAVKSLSKPEQWAMMLHYREDMPIKDISGKMKKKRECR